MKVVYFMEVLANHKSDRLIKIGHASDVLKRQTILSLGAPFEFRTVAILPYNPELERDLHYTLQQWWVRGEYFEPSEKIWTLIHALQVGKLLPEAYRQMAKVKDVWVQQRVRELMGQLPPAEAGGLQLGQKARRVR